VQKSKKKVYIQKKYVKKGVYKKIIDVSQWQGTINWAKVHPVTKLAVIRTAHDNEIDSNFATNVAGAKQSHVKFAQYISPIFTSNADAVKEAQLFAKNIDGKAKFLVLDNEVRSKKAKGKEQTYVTTFLNELKKHTKKHILYYSYQPFIDSNKIDYSAFNGGWIAAYNAKGPTTSQAFDLWQYSCTGSCAGITGAVDQSYIMNSKKLNKWLK
jgi:lysozyme